MTALTAPPAPPAERRPVPWTRLTWVAWRQRRTGLTWAAALLGALGLYLLIMGLRIRGAYAQVTGCHPAGSARCQDLAANFGIDYYRGNAASIFQNIGNPATISILVAILPLLLGAFAGAPLLARELETGTFRFAWTQGCGRLRWALAQLALPAAALTAAAAAFSVLYSWYARPFIAEGQIRRLNPFQFPLQGVAFAAWTLAAFAIGAFAGAAIRRTVPAIAASLAAWIALDLVTVVYLRPHYAAPLTTTGGAPHMPPLRLLSDWVLSSWTTGAGGRPVGETIVMNQAPQSVQYSSNYNAFHAWLSRHHYTQWWAYQPQSRFWHFQLIEGAWLLALSLILIAATVWLLRRRSA